MGASASYLLYLSWQKHSMQGYLARQQNCLPMMGDSQTAKDPPLAAKRKLIDDLWSQWVMEGRSPCLAFFDCLSWYL